MRIDLELEQAAAAVDPNYRPRNRGVKNMLAMLEQLGMKPGRYSGKDKPSGG